MGWQAVQPRQHCGAAVSTAAGTLGASGRGQGGQMASLGRLSRTAARLPLKDHPNRLSVFLAAAATSSAVSLSRSELPFLPHAGGCASTRAACTSSWSTAPGKPYAGLFSHSDGTRRNSAWLCLESTLHMLLPPYRCRRCCCCAPARQDVFNPCPHPLPTFVAGALWMCCCCRPPLLCVIPTGRFHPLPSSPKCVLQGHAGCAAAPHGAQPVGPSEAAAAHPQASAVVLGIEAITCESGAGVCALCADMAGLAQRTLHAWDALTLGPPILTWPANPFALFLQHSARHALPALPQHPAPRPQACVSVRSRVRVLG